MVLKATDRSLCIIDEFGKGTLTADGIGLLAGILTHFCIGSGGQGVDGANSVTPRVIATTHFTELFDARVLERHPQLAFFTMGTQISQVLETRTDRSYPFRARINAIYRGHRLLALR